MQLDRRIDQQVERFLESSAVAVIDQRIIEAV